MRALIAPRLIAAFAVVWLFVQTAGLVHQLDPTAHVDSAACHLCQHHDRQLNPPDPAPSAVRSSLLTHWTPVPTESVVTHRDALASPPARAPPNSLC